MHKVHMCIYSNRWNWNEISFGGSCRRTRQGEKATGTNGLVLRGKPFGVLQSPDIQLGDREKGAFTYIPNETSIIT